MLGSQRDKSREKRLERKLASLMAMDQSGVDQVASQQKDRDLRKFKHLKPSVYYSKFAAIVSAINDLEQTAIDEIDAFNHKNRRG